MEWIASEYLDDGRWGVLDADGHIVVALSVGLSREQAQAVAASHNTWRAASEGA